MRAIFALAIVAGVLTGPLIQAQTLDGSETYQLVSRDWTRGQYDVFVFLHREAGHAPVKITAWCQVAIANLAEKTKQSGTCNRIDVGTTIAVTSVVFIPKNGGGGTLSYPAGWAVERTHNNFIFMHGEGASFVREDFLIEREEAIVQ
jgi:hypothetical protein